MEAVRAGSRPDLKPAAAKSASRVGRPTARTGASRPSRQQPDVEASAPKKSPLVLVAAAVVLLLLGGGGWFLFGRGDHGDQVKDQIDAMVVRPGCSRGLIVAVAIGYVRVSSDERTNTFRFHESP